MLDHLDTLIAFAVVMTVVSLMITLLVQMVSAILGLRGSNLKWGLEELLRTISPSTATHATALSERVLTHPLISDSTVPQSALLRRVPGLAERWRLATAVHEEEVLGVLARIAEESSALRDAAGAVVARADDLKRWFSSAMDRTAQRFAVRMRVWTVIASIVVAFGLQLNAIRLLNRLSSDSDLRTRLVASAEVVATQAGQILGPEGSAVPAVYSEAVHELKQGLPEAGLWPEPPEFATRADAEAWIAAHTAGDSDRVIGRYRELVQAKLSRAIDRLSDQATTLRSEVSRSGLRLIPDPYPDLGAFLWSMCPVNRQFWGILVTVGLLSLGAPFWYNALKTVATLRPILATRQEERRS
jgi:hypothetical protein